MSGLVDLGPGNGSSVEAVKAASAHLRGSLGEALDNEAPFADADAQLLKFHGSYQQEERDQRAVRRASGAGKTYRFMIRTRVPGGVLTSQQYLAHDALADRYANGTLRITTRQGLQLHGVLKGNLRRTIRRINESLVSTYAACGDVNRNVMACPAPATCAAQAEAQAVAARIAEHLAPQSRAYHEIWIDGECAASSEGEAEPIYGATYLPRKFKIAVALPEDNCVDLLTNDVGLLAQIEDDRLCGFTVVVGGGVGRTHGKNETFPRLATPLAFISPDEVLEVVEAIVTLQRDHGDRTNRRHARFKYVVEERGIAWIRAEVERRIGRHLAPPRELDIRRADDHLGWQRAADGTWSLGIFVENGRVGDVPGRAMKSALRDVLESYPIEVRLTPQQSLILTGIDAEWRSAVEALLSGRGVATDPLLLDVRRDAMACPALPTCGLALTDAERVLPALMDRIAAEMHDLGIGERRLSIRMTGCPNGCARPYMGDVGLVGRSKGLYDVLLGGDRASLRMNWLYQAGVRLETIPETLGALLRAWRDSGSHASFGDWCDAQGRDALLNHVRVVA